MFFRDAARTDIPAGDDGSAFGMELTQIDGTTLELFSDPQLAEEFGVPVPARSPCCGSSGRCTRAPAVGGPPSSAVTSTGERAGHELEEHFGRGQLNLADRGFFSMDRWIRFAGTGAHLLWRVKNGAKCVPFKTLKVLKDGSELVLLRESSGADRRRKNAGDKALPYLPDTTARLARSTVRPAPAAAGPRPRRSGRRPPSGPVLDPPPHSHLCTARDG